jgi:molecular chaperone HtpG
MSIKTKKFDAEVSKILHIVINSIYTNKDIFLRELISNASDACDKLRYQAVRNPQLVNKEHTYKILVEASKSAQTIAVSDSGIGMDEEELIKHLGTIANSGTQKFIDQASENNKNGMQLIGQFGVGFYSAFMIADKVDVISRKAGTSNVYKWTSNGKGEYSIQEIELPKHTGTKILLHIKDKEKNFLENFKLKHIITTYSDHISFPISLINVEDKSKSEVINKVSALWQRNQSNITKEEYKEFYGHVSHLPGSPWLTIHNKLEGVLEYTNLLFIPDTQPLDLLHPDRKTRIKLYINRVFISEENNHLVPGYLRFIRGVVDSSDLPLNISRETLQNNHIIKKIKSSIVTKVLSALKSKAENNPIEYNNFLKNFGDILKEGLCGESTYEEKEKILEVCRFQTTSTGGDTISLDDYIHTMLPKQKEIYFLNGEKIEDIQKNPQLEGFKKRGVEVIYLTNHVDNFWPNSIRKYKNRELKSITSNKIDLNSIKELENKKQNNDGEKDNSKKYKDLISLIRNILKDKVEDVVISGKLIDSPACISIPEGSMNLRMEKFLRDQKQLHSKTTKILEINPSHAIWQKN